MFRHCTFTKNVLMKDQLVLHSYKLEISHSVIHPILKAVVFCANIKFKFYERF